MQVLRFIGLAEALRIDSLNTCVLICALLTGICRVQGVSLQCLVT